jgi:hypothetical protein
MDLDEFVRATLTQIINGVESAKKDHPERIAVRAFRSTTHPSGSVAISANRLGFLVDFDVEVTASTKGGGKLSVGVASLGFGGGGEASKESTHSNRIRFSVPINYQDDN